MTQMLEIVPHFQVLAHLSPEDEMILVKKLHALGEIVGVTGDGINDGPASNLCAGDGHPPPDYRPYQ
jgi:Ca2+-transporting ATPase